jgi:hypothetical protein
MDSRRTNNNTIKLYSTAMSDKKYPPVKQSTDQTEEEQVNIALGLSLHS